MARLLLDAGADMSYSLNSLRGLYWGLYREYYRGY